MIFNELMRGCTSDFNVHNRDPIGVQIDTYFQIIYTYDLLLHK